MLYWVQIRAHVRLQKCINCPFLSQFSYNASSVWIGVIVHNDRPFSQWMIIKIGYHVCVQHVVMVCNAIEITL
jgi:hypothetical protein